MKEGSDQTIFNKQDESSNYSHIHEILRPLQEQQGDAYIVELKQVSAMDRRFRSLESSYASLYTRVSDIETKVRRCKEEVQ